ncbi:MAG TPA: Rpn family recombination-promoting nuclease/putative transposase [Candidatus Aphodocola excrementigallinarum]|uniref:Rpn family recombination-promoting nuclease/putative transposase n=1 Tax=Candidatus Aphodocola excrementigallinarum TaxID=2840670 RepID=A0A9D1INA2_9FIRM|nr:Rpn family recombination-promoting nuclease/putative transposase [Candidatus Aphodocola excrementigallinarum]
MLKKGYKIIPMIYDKVFKGVLTSKDARGYLINLISNITGIERKKLINHLVFKNNEQQVTGVSEKKKITDMVVEIKDNIINLEMNKEYYEGLMDRNNEYISKIRESIILEGESYSDVPKIIQINFDNFNYYSPDKRVVIKFEMRDENGLKEGVGTESYHVILPNAKEKYYNEGSKDELVRELVIMMAEKNEELEKLIKDNMELRKVGEKIVEISNDERLQGWYDEEEHQRKVRNSLVEGAIKKGWNKGKADGLKEGIKEGIKKGIEEGIKKGTLKKQKEIAKNLLKEGIDIKIISSSTGLSIDEIKKL